MLQMTLKSRRSPLERKDSAQPTSKPVVRRKRKISEPLSFPWTTTRPKRISSTKSTRMQEDSRTRRMAAARRCSKAKENFDFG
jgi:hypothetical protein